jgi:hypothetical protein
VKRRRSSNSRIWLAEVWATTTFSRASDSAWRTTCASLALSTTRVVGLASSWLRSSAASGERAGKPASWIVLKLSSGARLSAKPQPESVTAAPRRRRRRIRRRR